MERFLIGGYVCKNVRQFFSLEFAYILSIIVFKNHIYEIRSSWLIKYGIFSSDPVLPSFAIYLLNLLSILLLRNNNLQSLLIG